VDRDEIGQAGAVIGVCQDITERKLAEEDLRNYADRLKVTSRRLVEVQEAERRLLARECTTGLGRTSPRWG